MFRCSQPCSQVSTWEHEIRHCLFPNKPGTPLGTLLGTGRTVEIQTKTNGLFPCSQDIPIKVKYIDIGVYAYRGEYKQAFCN